ncbi:intermembrane space AAA protease-like protein IAP-1 [Clohesyomyces aquaticus]|uniref:Intermembrane space AAA protease-like protein IAP-1 n=1 Tax=Clohesyomyces aquaticus TaxID=1231657 RepID=A0A1Y1YAV9_9PLEO|nr:intermembrane space AAA protease-like protein IAP-1 [Clohesyomyces aquaticus]
MAFQAPVTIQNVVSATSELWPTMSAILKSPWHGLGRQPTSVGGARQRSVATSTQTSSSSSSSPEGSYRSRLKLPDALASVPLSALRQMPSPEALKSIPTVSETINSVPHNALRLCNPFARSMPIKALMPRQYSTASRFGPLSNLRPVPRPGNIGLSLTQQRSIFGAPSHQVLSRLEQSANNKPNSPLAQGAFYAALLKADMPQIVVERHNTGQFASDPIVKGYYDKALQKLGQSATAASNQQGMHGNNLSPQQLQTVGQAVAAHVGGGQIGKMRGGSGEKSDPLYVVIEESMWSTIFKWARWLLTFGLCAYVALILITLFVETSGVLKKVGGGTTSEVRPEHQTTRFSDVHGCDEAKEELQDLVDFLKNPDRYNKLGGRLPKGVLLVGPPGTGKTLLARAVAGEAGVPFFYMSGSEFDEVYVGVGAKRVRELFATARAKAPAIVFIDEIDALGGKRNSRDANYHRQTLNQLLNDLDGFDQSTGVIFIAATNHPQLLDKALVRPGRFDRHVSVDLPDVRGRMAILKYHMKKIRLAPDVDLSVVARGTPGLSGAELENLANTAAIQASKTQSKFVTSEDLEFAKDKILMGAARKSRVVDLKEKLHTAYHEGGHALMGIYAKAGKDLHKATILPRGPAAGITFFLPTERHLTLAEYYVELQISMGGKIAEEIIYGANNVTGGASSDIQNATSMAQYMITECGFSDALGNVDLRSNYDRLSPQTKALIDSEVRRLLDESSAITRKTLLEHRKELDILAQALVQYETLDKEEILKVLKGEKLPDRLMAMPDTPIQIPGSPDSLPGSGSGSGAPA